MDYHKYKRILVTGAAGFMGGHLVDYLIDVGCEDVYGVDDLSGGYMSNVNPRSHFTELDLRDKARAREYIDEVKPELIFHLAADATEGRSQFTPLNCTERTYLAYLNVLVPAIRNGLKRVVLTSSMSVYGAQKPPFHEDMETKPEDIYAIAKAAKEQATKILSSVHGFEYVIVRPHNVYGERQNMADPYRNVIAIFINRLLSGKPFYIYGDGTQKRSFTYISDCVPPLAKCGFADELHSHIFNIGPGEETAVTINEMSEVVLKAFFEDKEIPEEFKPIYLPDRPREVKDAFCTHDKARKTLDYNPEVGLEEGVARMVAWARGLGHQQPQYLEEIEIVSDNIPKTWKDKLI